jgi:hypothetical protein
MLHGEPVATPRSAPEARSNDFGLDDELLDARRNGLAYEAEVNRAPIEPLASPPDRRTIIRRRLMEESRQRMRGDEIPTMDGIIAAGRDGDSDGVAAGLSGAWMPTRDAPTRGDDMPLFGGAPFDPARMRRAAGLSVNKQRVARTEPISGTDEDFLASLPDDPARWREVMGSHPWIDSPSKAQMIIMANAMKPDGSFRYSTDEILNATGYGSANSLGVLLNRARKLGVPVRDRTSGSGNRGGGAAGPPGGVQLNRIIEMLEASIRAGRPISNSTIAKRLGVTEGTVNTTLFIARSPTARPGITRRAPLALRKRLRQAEKARDEMLGTKRTRRYDPDLLSILLPYLVTGGAATAISTVASRDAQRRAINDALEQS